MQGNQGADRDTNADDSGGNERSVSRTGDGPDPRNSDASSPPIMSVCEDRMAHARGEALLVDLASRADMSRGDSPLYESERLVDWIDREVNSSHRSAEGWTAERIRASADRLRARVEASRLRVRPLAGSPAFDASRPYGTIPQVLDEVSAVGAAAFVDLSVAAGVGRDLWDEPCDTCVQLPEGMPAGRYIAIRVAGDSMTPLLHTGDTVLVRIGTQVVRDTVILARLPEAGYVVKRVGRVSRKQLELLSLNAEFPPIVVRRDEGTVIGTVVLRWCPHA